MSLKRPKSSYVMTMNSNSSEQDDFLNCIYALKNGWNRLKKLGSWRLVQKSLYLYKKDTKRVYDQFASYSTHNLSAKVYDPGYFTFGAQDSWYFGFPHIFIYYNRLDINNLLDNTIQAYKNGEFSPTFEALSIHLYSQLFNKIIELNHKELLFLKELLKPRHKRVYNIYEKFGKEYKSFHLTNAEEYYKYYTSFGISKFVNVDYGKFGLYVVLFNYQGDNDFNLPKNVNYDLVKFKQGSIRLIPRNIASIKNFDVLRAKLRQHNMETYKITKRTYYQNLHFFNGKRWSSFPKNPQNNTKLKLWINKLEKSSNNTVDYYLKPQLLKNHPIYADIQLNQDNITYRKKMEDLLKVLDGLVYTTDITKIKDVTELSEGNIAQKIDFLQQNKLYSITPHYYNKLGLGFSNSIFCYDSDSRKRQLFLKTIYYYFPTALIYSSTEGAILVIGKLPKKWKKKTYQKLHALALQQLEIYNNDGTFDSHIQLAPLLDPLKTKYALTEDLRRQLLFLDFLDDA